MRSRRQQTKELIENTNGPGVGKRLTGNRDQRMSRILLKPKLPAFERKTRDPLSPLWGRFSDRTERLGKESDIEKRRITRRVSHTKVVSDHTAS
jgi:hypothetical protein